MPPNTAIDLVTVKNYLEYMARDVGKKETRLERLALLITAASQQFVGLAGGRAFVQAADTMEFDGTGKGRIIVRNPPIDTGGTITISYWNGTGWTEATAGTYPRQFESDLGLVRLTSAVFHRVRWKILYTGGWTIATMPMDVQMAVCQLVHRAEQRADGKEGVTTESLAADQTMSFDLDKLATDPIRKVATKYRVVYTP